MKTNRIPRKICRIGNLGQKENFSVFLLSDERSFQRRGSDLLPRPLHSKNSHLEAVSLIRWMWTYVDCMINTTHNTMQSWQCMSLCNAMQCHRPSLDSQSHESRSTEPQNDFLIIFQQLLIQIFIQTFSFYTHLVIVNKKNSPKSSWNSSNSNPCFSWQWNSKFVSDI